MRITYLRVKELLCTCVIVKRKLYLCNTVELPAVRFIEVIAVRDTNETQPLFDI